MQPSNASDADPAARASFAVGAGSPVSGGRDNRSGIGQTWCGFGCRRAGAEPARGVEVVVRSWRFVLALGLGGCGPSVDQFLVQYQDLTCKKWVSCGNLNPLGLSYEECLELDSVESSSCEYDRKAAKACLDALEASTSCDDDPAELPDCVAALAGEGCDGTPTTTDSGPDLVHETFTQTQISPVDILWVLDGQSGATQALDTAMEPMWEQLLLTDPSWQMGVLDAGLTTNRYALIEATWFTWPPPNGAFGVTGGGGSPRFDETVYSALELRGESVNNKDFLRAGASLYTIYVTDREDTSDTSVISAREFLDWYGGLSSNARIAVITSGSARNYWEDEVVGASLFESGSDAAIEKAVRGAVLEAIGLETSFQLQGEPSEPPATVEVVYRAHADVYELDKEYTYDVRSRTISFKRVIPPPNSVVRVTYETAAETTTTNGAE